MPTWERWRKRFDEIEILTSGGLELTKVPDILKELKLLEADTGKVLVSGHDWPEDVQQRLYTTLVEVIDSIWDLLKSNPDLSLVIRQSLYSLCLVTLRTLGQLFSLPRCSIAFESTSMLLEFIDTTVFGKILYSSDLVCIAVHLWVTVQRKFFGSSYMDLMNIIEKKEFPESIKLACINSLICEYPDPELIVFIYKSDNSFFLPPRQSANQSDPEVNIIKAKYCLQLCSSLKVTAGSLPREIEIRLFEVTYAYISNRLETTIDIIKVLCFDSLRNLLEYDHTHRKDELNRQLLSRIDSYLDDCQGALFRTVCIAVELLGVERSFICCPNLVEYCFRFLEDRNDVPNYLVELVARICSFKLTLFVQKLTATSSKASLKVIDVIIPKLCRKDPFIINRLIDMGLLNDPKVDLKFKLRLLHLCINQSTYSDPVNTQDLLSESIFHHDESIRLQSLTVIIESRKLSTPFPPEHLDLIKESLDMGLTIQEPCNRQRFSVLMEKLFKRLKSLTESSNRDSNQENLSVYRSFIAGLLKICFNSLYIDGYFARRTLALELVEMILLNYSDATHLNLKDIFDQLEPFRCIYSTLINCLIEDSLEDTKRLAINVLIILVKQQVIVLASDEIETIREKAFSMLLNINPINVLSASYLFRCLTRLVSLDDLTKKIEINLDLLSILAHQIEKAITETRESILDGAVFNPIHSRLTTVHSLIESLEPECFDSHQSDWSQLIVQIGEICFQASEVVSCIVCNDSPEGFLPMDLKPLDDEIVNKIMGRECVTSPILAEKRRDITSQMLLVFGWKTIMESALILGTICERIDHSPLDSSNPSVIDCSFVEKVLNYFVHHLKELKHRGAFEQAYNGFSMVVKCIWRRPCSCFRVVESLLDEILSDLANEGTDSSIEPKCITRRSAGLPFVTQAIVSSEPKENRNKLLGQVFNSLIRIISKPTAEDWQKVHCLNVLRALVKDQRLGERVDPYLEDCLKVAINHFGYPNYSVSNSGSMLFSALTVRIFGVNRSKDYHHKKNTMSAKHFFLRFSSMDTFISDHISQTSSHQVLPIILIILRLWPTLQETDCLLLSYLEPLKALCFSSPSAKIRDLAAQALAQIISADNKLIASSVDLICKELNSPDLTCNHLDGLISFMYQFVFHFVKHIESDRSYAKLIPTLTEHTSHLLLSIKSTGSCNGSSSSSIADWTEKPLYSYSRFVLTVEILLREQLIILEDQMVCDLHTICLSFLNLYKSNPQNINLTSSQDFLVKLIHFTLCYSPNEIRNKCLFHVLSPNAPPEMVHFRTVIFKFLTHSLIKDLDPLEASFREEIMSDYEINIPEPILSIEPQTKSMEPKKLLQLISSCPEYKCLFDRIDSLATFAPQRNLQQLFYSLHCAISRLSTDDLSQWTSLFEVCANTLFEDPDHTKLIEETLALFYLVLSDIWFHRINSSNAMVYHEKLNQFCSSVVTLAHIDKVDLSRKIAVTIVGKLLPVLIQSVTVANKGLKFYLTSLASLWQAIPNLLQDNLPAIRESTATLCNHLFTSYFKTPLEPPPHGTLLNGSFQLLFSVFSNLGKQDSLRTLLIKLIVDQHSITENEGEQERFFDKSKINFIEDPVQLIIIATNHLGKLVSSVDCNFFHSTISQYHKQSRVTREPDSVIGLADYFNQTKCKLDRLIGCFLEKLTDANLTLEIIKMLMMIQLWIQSKPICDECNSAKGLIKGSLEANDYQSRVIFFVAGQLQAIQTLL